MTPHRGILPSWKYLASVHRGLTTTCDLCPPKPYLSLGVPDDEIDSISNVVVRRAVFTTLSHDQGFSSSSHDLDGTYEDSNTFLEVRVVDRLGQDRVPHERLARNRRADPEFFEHTICWDFRDQECWFRNEREILPLSESGLIPAQWLAAIRPGDIVQIVPRAQFPAWINYVAEARIELWVEIVKKSRVARTLSIQNSRAVYLGLSHEKKEIRLVAIEPSKDPDQPVHLTLHRTYLTDQDRLQYEALSYCWGDHDETFPITLIDEEGSPFQLLVRPNVGHAMSRLRHSDRVRMFWIDLLCINQNDKAERSRQVALMGEIYASSQSVCVWLGELDEIVHTQKDLEVLQQIAAACVPGRVTVLCGHYELPWWAIMQANSCLFKGFRDHRNNTMPSLWMELFAVPRNKQDPRHVTPGSRKSILELVIRSLDFKATDPQDRIFALLGFGEETHQVDSLPRLIRPDYNKSPAEVFCDFTLWWIKHYKSLRILSAVHTLRNRTWVDLSGDHAAHRDDNFLESREQPTWTLWSNGDSTWSRGTLALDEPHPFRACGDTRIDLDTLDGDDSFRRSHNINRFVPAFRGVRIGTIISIEAYSLSHLITTQPSDMAKTFLRVFDPTGIQGTWRNTGSSLGAVVDTLSQEVALSLRNHVSNHAHSGLYRKTFLPCLGRCLFKTLEGHTGLCPSPARAGDIVVVLHGGTVPYLLRPHEIEGLYEFVGECYLDGFMSGEVFHDQEVMPHEDIFRLI